MPLSRALCGPPAALLNNRLQDTQGFLSPAGDIGVIILRQPDQDLSGDMWVLGNPITNIKVVVLGKLLQDLCRGVGIFGHTQAYLNAWIPGHLHESSYRRT